MQLELVRGIAAMSNEFLVSAMETTERQGERRTQKGKERILSFGEGWFVCDFYHNGTKLYSLLVTTSNLVGEMESRGFI